MHRRSSRIAVKTLRHGSWSDSDQGDLISLDGWLCKLALFESFGVVAQ